MSNRIRESAGRAGTYASDKLQGARGSAREAVDAARERASNAYQSARSSANDAGRRAAEGVDAYPIAALIGGIALGAAAGALLPRTRQENDLLGGVGEKLNSAALAAAAAARDSGRDKLDELGVNAARDQVSKIFDQLSGGGQSRSGASGQAGSSDEDTNGGSNGGAAASGNAGVTTTA